MAKSTSVAAMDACIHSMRPLAQHYGSVHSKICFLLIVDSLALCPGSLFERSDYSTFLAYDAQTGEIAWTAPLTDVRVSPAVRGGTLYVGSFDGRLAALDAKTGTPIWFARGNCCI